MSKPGNDAGVLVLCKMYQTANQGNPDMCDYSMHAVASRPAEIADTLVSTGFAGTLTRGFAAVDQPTVAVCLLPGTEIAFEENARVRGFLFNRRVGDRLARFRQIDTDQAGRHHDALEFSNGRIVMVTHLAAGQRAKVLQLPVDPTKRSTAVSAAADVRRRTVAF